MTDAERLMNAITKFENLKGQREFSLRLADWLRRHPEYDTDTVPLDLLADEIERAIAKEQAK